MFFIGHFFKRISSDFRQKELLPLKLLFFVHSSTLYVLYPYLTIHMRELGINVEETAIMSAVTPIVAIIMPPIAGVIADRIGNFKVILSLFSGLGGAVSLFLLLVPVGRIVITYPQRTLLQTACSNGSVYMSVAEPYPCHRVHNRSMEIPVQLESCGLACFPPPSLAESFQGKDGGLTEWDLLTARNYSVVITDMETNTSDTYSYRLEGGPKPPRPHLQNKNQVRQSRELENSGHFTTTVRRLADGALFFPTSGLYKFECARSDGRCGPRRRGTAGPNRPGPAQYRMTLHQRSHPSATSAEHRLHLVSLARNLTDGQGHPTSWNSTCPAQLGGEEEKVVVPIVKKLRTEEHSGFEDDAGGEGTETEEVLFEDCSVRCLATVRRSHVCTNRDKLTEFDIRLTFWFYLSIRVFIGMISGTAFAMFEGAVIAILREHKADYGLQRIYATIGGMISSPVSGWLIDYASEVNGFTDFRPAFYLYAGLKIVSAMLMCTINLEFKVPATNVLSDVVTVLKKIEIVALFITCFILGTAWGYIESFLFWLLQDLGASRSLMGITITVGGIAGLPLLVMSGPIIDRIGHANVLFIGFIFYGIRLIGYSLIYNPWMCLIFEAMESVTSSLAFTAAVTYAAKLSTTTTDSSIQGLLGGLYFGVGKGSGSLIGGYLMKAVGTRPTYQIFAAMTLVTGCLYYLFNKFYIVHHCDTSPDKMKPEKNDKAEKKEASEAKKSAETNHLTIESIPMKNCIKASDKSTNEQSNNKESKIESQIVNNHISNCNANEAFEMEEETTGDEKKDQHEKR